MHWRQMWADQSVGLSSLVIWLIWYLDIGTGACVCLSERSCECTRAYLHSVILLVRGQQKWGDCQQWESIKTCCWQSVSKHCDLLRISQQTLQERIRSEWEEPFRRWAALLSTDVYIKYIYRNIIQFIRCWGPNVAFVTDSRTALSWELVIHHLWFKSWISTFERLFTFLFWLFLC